MKRNLMRPPKGRNSISESAEDPFDLWSHHMAGATPLTALFAAPGRGYRHCNLRGGCRGWSGRVGRERHFAQWVPFSIWPSRSLISTASTSTRWGWILMIVGAVGTVLSIIVMVVPNIGRRRTVVYDGRGNVVSKVDSAH